MTWRWIKNPGWRTLCERGTLMQILRGGAGVVEYGCGLRGVYRLNQGWAVGMDDGRRVYADVLVGESHPA